MNHLIEPGSISYDHVGLISVALDGDAVAHHGAHAIQDLHACVCVCDTYHGRRFAACISSPA
jgi:hypothetical protein